MAPARGPRRTLVPMLLATAACALAAVPVTGGSGPADAPVHVHMIMGYFEPYVVRVPAGTTVWWDSHDGVPHTATASDGSWDSGVILGEPVPAPWPAPVQGLFRFEHTFDLPGFHRYECAFHGSGAVLPGAMSGYVQVT